MPIYETVILCQKTIEIRKFVKICDEYVHNHEYTPDNSTYDSVTSVRELEVLHTVAIWTFTFHKKTGCV